MSPLTVRLADAADMAGVCEMVNYYIETTTFNFRTAPQEPAEWVKDWNQYHDRYPWLVATRDQRLVGMAYATPWKARAAYNWSIEVTVYVAPDAARQGIGRALYKRLLEIADQQNYRTQIAVIALPNAPSVALHESFGFRHAGTLQDVGYKFGAWRDVGFWQRRSSTDDVEPSQIGKITDITP